MSPPLKKRFYPERMDMARVVREFSAEAGLGRIQQKPTSQQKTPALEDQNLGGKLPLTCRKCRVIYFPKIISGVECPFCGYSGQEDDARRAHG